MSFVEIVLVIPLGFIAGVILNNILFRGIMLYSKNPNVSALKKKQESFLHSLLFGVIYIGLAILLNKSKTNLIEWYEITEISDFSIPAIILIALAILWLYFEKDEEKKAYLALSFIGLCIITTLFFLLVK